MGTYLVHQHREGVNIRLFGVNTSVQPELLRMNEFWSEPPYRARLAFHSSGKRLYIRLQCREDRRRSKVPETGRVVLVDENVKL